MKVDNRLESREFFNYLSKMIGFHHLHVVMFGIKGNM